MCEATLCRLGVVSQTQTTSLSLSKRHLRYTRTDWGQVPMSPGSICGDPMDGTVSIEEWGNVIMTHV